MSFGASLFSYLMKYSTSISISYGISIQSSLGVSSSTLFRRKRQTTSTNSTNSTEEIDADGFPAAKDVKCFYTFTVTFHKVKFTNVSSRINPCKPGNQVDAEPPYIEIKDNFNTTIRLCDLTTDYTINSFGNEITVEFIGDRDSTMTPNVTFSVQRSKECCGGIFYSKYNTVKAVSQTMATSPNYPDEYSANSVCPYIFKCIPEKENGTCNVALHFIDWEIESHNQNTFNLLNARKKRQIIASTGSSNETNSLIALAAAKKLRCSDDDQMWISGCGNIYPRKSEQYCSGDHPDSYIAEGQILLLFLTNGGTQDRGFVVYYHTLDPLYGVYSREENNSTSCRCGQGDFKKYKQLEKKRIRKLKNTDGSLGRSVQRVRKVRKNDRENDQNRLKRIKRENSERNGPKRRRLPMVNGGEKRRRRRPNTDADKKALIKSPTSSRGTKNTERGDASRRALKKIKSQKPEKVIRKKVRTNQVKRRHPDTDDRVFNGKVMKNIASSPYAAMVVLQRIAKKKKKNDKRNTTLKRSKRKTTLVKQASSQKKKKKKPKIKNADKILRECSGVIISSNFVLTTTSCCTYCVKLWKRKWLKRQRKEESAIIGAIATEPPSNGNNSDIAIAGLQSKRDVSGKNILERHPRQAGEMLKQKEGNQLTNKFRSIRWNNLGIFLGSSKLKNNQRKFRDAEKVRRVYIPTECYKKLSKKRDGMAAPDKNSYEIVCPVLIRLRKPIEFSDEVKPACLPVYESFDINNETMLTVGWGNSKDKKRQKRGPLKLRMATGLKPLSGKECMGLLNKRIDDSMFCTRPSDSSMCIQDNGSPLMTYRPDEKGYGEHMTMVAMLAHPGCNKDTVNKKKKDKKDKKKKDKKDKKKKKKKDKKKKRKKDKKKKKKDKKKNNRANSNQKDKNRGNQRGLAAKKGTDGAKRKTNKGLNKKGKGKDKSLKGRQRNNGDNQRENNNKNRRDENKNPSKGKSKVNKAMYKGENNRIIKKSPSREKREAGEKSQRKRKVKKIKKESYNENHPNSGIRRPVTKDNLSGRGIPRKPATRNNSSGQGKSRNVNQQNRKGTKRTGNRKKGNKQSGGGNTGERSKIRKKSGNAGVTKTIRRKPSVDVEVRKKNEKRKSPNIKYNRKIVNKGQVDTWIKFGPYLNWLIKLVYEDNESICYRPQHIPTAIETKGTNNKHDCDGFPFRVDTAGDWPDS